MIVKKLIVNYKMYRPVVQEVKAIEKRSWDEDGTYCNVGFEFNGYHYDLKLSRTEAESLIHDLNNFIDDTKKGVK